MNMRTTLDPFGGGAPIVDKMLGNAYQTVRLVAQYIEEVRHVSHHMKNVYDVSQHLPMLTELHGNMPGLGGPHTNLAASLVQVGGNLPSELPTGDLQTVLIGLSARIKALEGAQP